MMTVRIEGSQWTVQEDSEERRWTGRNEGGQGGEQRGGERGQGGERDVKLSC